ncbi:CHAT domain-containing protein [Frankia sp. AgW1.1]|nr:CHAT domain-containing protein [Frankia sp. AgW1.1]MBL7624896.1 CHAT domain-containing protein [Frankia sp. AgB1.8]
MHEGATKMRERQLSRVRARLQRLSSSQDRAAVLDADAVADVEAMVESVSDLSDDIEIAHAAGWLHWMRYQLLDDGNDQQDLAAALTFFAHVYKDRPDAVPDQVRVHFSESLPTPPSTPEVLATHAAVRLDMAQRSGDRGALDAAITFLHQALTACPPDDPNQAVYLSDLGVALKIRFEQSGVQSDIDSAIEAGRAAVALSPLDHPRLAAALSNLGLSLRTRFELAGAKSDLDAAVEALRAGVRVAPTGSLDRAMNLYNLGFALQARFERAGAESDLRAAIKTHSAAAAAIPSDYPDRAIRLSELSFALYDGFERTGDQADLDAAVHAHREAVEATPTDHPDRAMRLSNLGGLLRARFERTGAATDLDKAIKAIDAATAAATDDDPGRSMYFSNLGGVLHVRFDLTGSRSDLDAAIEAHRDALAAAPDDAPSRGFNFSDLGEMFHLRFDLTGSRSDLEEAIEATRTTIAAMPINDPRRANPLSNLGRMLRTRFEQTGNLNDLDEAVEAAEAAAAAIDASDARRAMLSSNLGAALHTRFQRRGSQADLDAAMQACKAAVAASSADDPDLGMYLANLGAGLRIRFERTGAISDLDAAIEASDAAVAATPTGHSNYATYLSNHGLALQVRFERTGARSDLDAAVEAGRGAVAATSVDNRDRASYLTNLGVALTTRYGLLGTQDDSDEALETVRFALDAASADHPHYPDHLNNLGNILQLRFRKTGSQSDLDAAIVASQASVTASPADDPHRSGRLLNLGMALGSRFERTGSEPDLIAATQACRAAAKVQEASPRSRAVAARYWGLSAAMGKRWADAADGFQTSINLLGHIAPRHLTRPDQQHILAGIGNLAADAAACCVRAGMVGRAVELFEQGRGVLLGQALDTRTDLTALTEQHPELATSFIHLRDVLDRANDPPPQSQTPPGNDTAGANQRAAGMAFEELITSIRSLAGFSTFLRPPPIAELLTTSTDGPVVVVAVSQFGSYALLLNSSHVETVSLTELTPQALYDQVTGFLSTLSDATFSAVQTRIGELLGWLWDVLAGPILDRLGFVSPPADGAAWRRVWWCTSGLLSFLPLHAAGHHHTRFDTHPATVLDRVISSYTPTIRVLDHARRSGPTDAAGQVSLGAEGRLVAVAMPHTPGASDLPGAETEANSLRARFPGHVDVVTGELVSRQTVLDLLPAVRWAHFACHGATDLADPSMSRLLLADQPLTVLDISKLRLPDAQLAFLSACSTAMPSGQLIDEAIHLASAFQLAGYRHVIATLWPVEDAVAAFLADEIYSDLSGPSPGKPAAALHQAARWLRNLDLERPSRWASHIHNGI